jgi:putative lipoprotein (rSAM/lipoprotein system)
MSNKVLKYILAVIGFVFGFSANVAAQYGVPPSNFRIKGVVLSENDKTPVQNIKVKINEKKKWIASSSTNSKGEFVFHITDEELGDTIFLNVSDVDGASNGSYKNKDTILKFVWNDFKSIQDNFYDGENDPAVKIYLKPEAIKPKGKKKKNGK